MASRNISNETAPKASRVRRLSAHDQRHGQTPTQQQQSTNGLARHTRSKKTGIAPASATPRASGYQTASKAMVTNTESASHEASTQNDEDYVYIRVPVDNGGASG